MTSYSDDDITFFALTYRDYEAAAECLTDLRRHYPDSRVVFRADGDPDNRFPGLAKRFNVDYYAEPRLFEVHNGGAIVERMFEIYQKRPTPYLFKIDPDTVVHRRFSSLPTRCGVFGTLQREHDTPSIQGGFMGYTRDAIERILKSQMLRDTRLRAPEEFVNESLYFVRMMERKNMCGLVSFDWIIGWIASELNLPMYAFDEVNSRWKVASSPDLRYAVTHPRATTTE